MNNDDYSDSSDSSDEDYVPGAGTATGDIPSEVDSDGDAEEPLSDADDDDTGARTKRRPKTLKKKASKNGTKCEPASDTSHNPEESNKEPAKTAEQVQEEKKKHADDLWASFKRDTGFRNKTAVHSPTNGTGTKSNVQSEPAKPKQPDTVKITQIFEFAGEAVKVEKEVKADSAEARLSLPNSQASSSPAASSSLEMSGTLGPKRKSAGLGGIGSVLSQINKKQKLSVLDKTKMDWNQYKQKEKIEDELESYKKGKDGYLEKQDFLQRADLRQFEIEKEVRAVERSKRMSNAP